ncbi:MAG TPA: hypothetical protein VJ818_08585, partial [Actinomycetota bacterium]|nr:hypothetical protein [Actinomycetota bacterium]
QKHIGLVVDDENIERRALCHVREQIELPASMANHIPAATTSFRPTDRSYWHRTWTCRQA